MGGARGLAGLPPTNPRGPTGRGVASSKLDYGDFAGREFDDFVDGVDHLIAAGLVDRARVGITGGSYGGRAPAPGAACFFYPPPRSPPPEKKPPASPPASPWNSIAS